MKSAIIIIPAERYDTENGWLRTNLGVDGDCIQVRLSATQLEPPTHYATNWEVLSDAHYTKLYNRFQNNNGCKLLNGDRYTFEEACASVGLYPISWLGVPPL